MKLSIIELEPNPGSIVRSFLLIDANSDKVTDSNWLLTFKHESVDTLQDVAARHLAVAGIVAQFSLVTDNETLNTMLNS